MIDAAHSQLTLTYRDIQILELIYSYNTCGADHIRIKLFGASDNPGKYGPKVACHRRLAILKQAGFVTSRRLSSLSGIGSGKQIFGLTKQGREVLATELEVSRSEIKRLRELETPYAGAHHLAVCDFRLCLELACQQGSAAALEWVSERELRLPPTTKVSDPRIKLEGRPLPEIPLIPDGRFTISPGNSELEPAIFQLEMDLGTIPGKRMQTKLAGYFALSRRQPVLILWVVPDEKRLEAIASWALTLSRELGGDPSIFWITTRDWISAQTILQPVWKVVGGPDSYSLIPISSEDSTQPNKLGFSQLTSRQSLLWPPSS